MSTVNKEHTHRSTDKMISVANDLNEPIEFEYQIHKPPLLARRRKARRSNPRKQPRKR